MLVRQQGQIELTDIGARLVQRAKSMLGMAEAMRLEATDARDLALGILRIGSFGPTSSQRLLPTILREFRAAYPGIEVHIDEGHDRRVVQWLLEHRVDVGFVTLPEGQFDTYPLIEDQMVAVLLLDHGLASQASVSLSDLCADPFVLTEAGSSELVTQLFAAARLQPRVRYRTSQLMSTLAAVERGDAVIVVAQSSLPQRASAEYLTRPLNPAVRRVVGLAVLDKTQSSTATQAFIAVACKCYGGDCSGRQRVDRLA